MDVFGIPFIDLSIILRHHDMEVMIFWRTLREHLLVPGTFKQLLSERGDLRNDLSRMLKNKGFTICKSNLQK